MADQSGGGLGLRAHHCHRRREETRPRPRHPDAVEQQPGHRHEQLGVVQPDHHHGAGPAGEAHGLTERPGGAAGLDDGVRAIAGGPLGHGGREIGRRYVVDDVGAEFPGGGEAVGQQVSHEDGDPGLPGAQQHAQTDRPGAEDDDPVPRHSSGPPQCHSGHRGRLDQGRDLRRDVVDSVQVVGRHRHGLGQSARPGDSIRRERRAGRPLTAPADPAPAAREAGVDRHDIPQRQVPGGPVRRQLLHHTGDLMALPQGEPDAGALAGPHVHVGAAQADGRHPDQCLLRCGHGFGDVDQLHPATADGDRGPHVTARQTSRGGPAPASCRPCSAGAHPARWDGDRCPPPPWPRPARRPGRG